jgi:hypothetical protein
MNRNVLSIVVIRTIIPKQAASTRHIVFRVSVGRGEWKSRSIIVDDRAKYANRVIRDSRNSGTPANALNGACLASLMSCCSPSLDAELAGRARTRQFCGGSAGLNTCFLLR